MGAVIFVQVGDDGEILQAANEVQSRRSDSTRFSCPQSDASQISVDDLAPDDPMEQIDVGTHTNIDVDREDPTDGYEYLPFFEWIRGFLTMVGDERELKVLSHLHSSYRF